MSEAARKELDQHINEFSDERAKANAAAALEEAERRKRELEQRVQNRKGWISYYRKLCLVHEQRASEFKRRIEELESQG
jgi:hypothetical protein